MVEHETARKVRQSGAIDVFASIETTGTRKKSDCGEETLFVHLARIEHLTYHEPPLRLVVNSTASSVDGTPAFEQQN